MKDVNGVPFDEFKKDLSIKLEDQKAIYLKDMAPTKVPCNHETSFLGPNFQMASAGKISVETIKLLLAEISLLDQRWLNGIFADPTMPNHMYWFWTIPADFSIT